jgi:predicted nucleic acid-binding protein
MECVLDCSVALVWALPDETSKWADRFLARVSRESVLWVPALWWYELSNALTVARRRQRLAEADSVRLVELYGMLPIQTDTYLGTDAMWRFHALAQEYALSAYDAAYLELAQRRGLGLATLDRGLVTAARRAGIKVIHP